MNKILAIRIKNVEKVDNNWCQSMYPKIEDSKYREMLLDDNYMGDTGLDIFCPEDKIIPAGSISFKIPLGIKISCKMIESSMNNEIIMKPSSIELWPRSSCGSKTPLRLSNSIGLIDRQYRGEIMAIVDNISQEDYRIQKGDRLFQLVAPGHLPIYYQILNELEQLDDTERGEKGFGSTGK